MPILVNTDRPPVASTFMHGLGEIVQFSVLDPVAPGKITLQRKPLLPGFETLVARGGASEGSGGGASSGGTDMTTIYIAGGVALAALVGVYFWKKSRG